MRSPCLHGNLMGLTLSVSFFLSNREGKQRAAYLDDANEFLHLKPNVDSKTSFLTLTMHIILYFYMDVY